MAIFLQSLLNEKIKPFASEILKTHANHGDLTVVVKKEKIREVLKFLKEEPELQFEMLMDLGGVDLLQLAADDEPGRDRFEVVYHLFSFTQGTRLRVRARVPEADPRIDSVIGLWGAADWFERECFDMFGIRFEGHPNLKRLLLYEEFEGHPLRKDYPIAKRQKFPTPQEVI